jgi:hypothetical protein
MIQSSIVSLATYFTEVKDPRAQHRIEHQINHLRMGAMWV